MSGRSIWKTTSAEAMNLESVILNNSSGRRGYSWGQNASHQMRRRYYQFVSIPWSNDASRALAQMSGALSLKGASAPQLRIQFRKADGQETDTVRIRVVHKFYSAVSFSGSDGRVSSGLNL